MKKAFQYGFLALTVAVSVAACKGGHNAENQDSTMVDKTAVDSSAQKASDAHADSITDESALRDSTNK